jgi:hypothetical protein
MSRNRTRKRQQQQQPAIAPPIATESGLFETRPFAAPGGEFAQSAPSGFAANGHSLSRISPTATPTVQAKLTVGAAHDPYEQQADQTAATVVSRLNQPSFDPSPRRKRKRQHDPAPLSIQPLGTAAPAQAGPAPSKVERSIEAKRGQGNPLEDSTRNQMEGAFGHDFSGVNVHTDGESDQLNQSLSSRAFTTGQDIFFRQGEYAPSQRGGQELLAHELAHVMQQSGHQPSSMRLKQIQRVVGSRGQDPLVEYTNNPNTKSLMYGLEAPGKYRYKTKQRIRNANVLPPTKRLTIDEYNRDIGFNALIGARGQSPVGIFIVREALADPAPIANWGNYLGAKAGNDVAADNDLQAWIRKLVANQNSIGLYDYGDRTKTGTFGFRKRAGVKRLGQKSRFTKNMWANTAANITPKDINRWLSPARDSTQAVNDIGNLPQAKVDALHEWIQKAFFRRTSKLGIDFVTNDMNSTIHFNQAGAVDYSSIDPMMQMPLHGGLEFSSNYDRQQANVANRSITISELRHAKKQIARGNINPNKINFYDEIQ